MVILLFNVNVTVENKQGYICVVNISLKVTFELHAWTLLCPQAVIWVTDSLFYYPALL